MAGLGAAPKGLGGPAPGSMQPQSRPMGPPGYGAPPGMMPPGYPPKMPPGMPPGFPPGMPPKMGMPPGMPPGFPPGMPPGMMPPGMPPGMMPPGFPPGMPPGMMPPPGVRRFLPCYPFFASTFKFARRVPRMRIWIALLNLCETTTLNYCLPSDLGSFLFFLLSLCTPRSLFAPSFLTWPIILCLLQYGGRPPGQ